MITRRYREAIGLLRKAVEVEPDLYSAHTELGVNLLRQNLIDEAQQHLAVAYRGDPFSAPVVNTLRLIDSYGNFVVSRHEADSKPGSAPNHGSILRLSKKEAPVIEPYVLDLVNRTIATYTKRYGFELKEPVVVELYPLIIEAQCFCGSRSLDYCWRWGRRFVLCSSMVCRGISSSMRRRGRSVFSVSGFRP